MGSHTKFQNPKTNPSERKLDRKKEKMTRNNPIHEQCHSLRLEVGAWSLVEEEWEGRGREYKGVGGNAHTSFRLLSLLFRVAGWLVGVCPRAAHPLLFDQNSLYTLEQFSILYHYVIES